MAEKKTKKEKEEELRETLTEIVAPAPPPPDAPKVFREKGGRLTGVEIEGKPFLGLDPETVRNLIRRREEKLATPPGAVEVAEAQQQQERVEQAPAALEQAGAFEQVTPREVSLKSKPKAGEEIPLIGTGISAVESVLANAARKGFIPIFEPGSEAVTGEKAFPIPMTEETLREASLREISIRSFDEGISRRESVGSLIEAIPIVGQVANRYASGLTETPSSNAQDVLAEINRIKEAASTGQEKVRNNLEEPDFGLSRAREMEEDLAKLEGRIKILILTSSILRASSDNVNTIQEQILEAREKVSRYRRAASFGLTAQLTGTGRVVPTDEQMFFELKRLNENK